MTVKGNSKPSNQSDKPKPTHDPKARSLGLLGKWGAIVAASGLAFSMLIWLALSTRETRAAIQAYTRLTAAVNAQDLNLVKGLCTQRFVDTHRLKAAPEGGLVGFPRFIHKNFQAWREGQAVWVCPTNRVGPIYQFIQEAGVWKYDGLVGLLRSGHQIMVLPEESRNGSEESLIGP